MSLSGNEFLLQTPQNEIKAKDSNTEPLNADFVTVGGFTSNDLEISATEIETTNKSSNQNKEILNGQGIVSLSLSGSGIMQDDALLKALEANEISQDLRWFRMIRDDGRRFTALFKIVSFQNNGNYDGVVNFSISLMSSGTIFIEDSSGQKFDSGKRTITAFNNLIASLNYRLPRTNNYEFASLPARGNERKDALDAYLATLDLTTFAVQTALPDTPIVLTGATQADRFAFPIILIEKSQLENRTLQVLDFLGIAIDPQPLNDVNVSGTDYSAFFFQPALANAETLSITLQAG